MSQSLLQSIWLIPCYALLGCIFSILWFPNIIRSTGPRPSAYINIIFTLFAFFHGVIAFPAVLNHPPTHLSIPWFQVAGLDLTIPLELSSLTVGATIVITGINVLAQVFAVGYMEMDWGLARFFSLLGFFEAGMCALALCDSLFFAYIILEVLTVGTYLLTGLWFNQSLVVAGARDAFLTKRVGDLLLLMGVLGLYPLSHTWDFPQLTEWAATAHVDPGIMTWVGLGLIAGPVAKCAQFPLHLWLDEAMEGPLPASILRNSVVLSTGAWVLIKLQAVLALSPIVLSVITLIGLVTAIGGAALAIAQIDIKRSISYIVSSYMGLIFIAVGTQQERSAYMLMVVHAIAIALLMMCIGNVIWNCITQDLRQYGGLWKRRPMSGLSFIIGGLALIALPPLGGFWALLSLIDGLWKIQPGLTILLVLTNFLIAFSLTRTFCLIWGGDPKPMTSRAPEVFWPMMLPTMITMGFALHTPHILQTLSLLPPWSAVDPYQILVLLGSGVLGCGISGFIYLSPIVSKPIMVPQWVEATVNYFTWAPVNAPGREDPVMYSSPVSLTPSLYRNGVVPIIRVFAQFMSWLDRNLVDGVVNLVGSLTLFSGNNLKYSTIGQTQFYVLTILLGTALLGICLCWSVFSDFFLVS